MKNIMLVLLALVLVSSMALAQASNAISTITLSAAATALTLAPQNGGAEGLIRGYTYAVVYDAYAAACVVSPNLNGEAAVDQVGVDISGDVSTNVVVEMDLPDHLLGIAGTSMSITFPGSGPGGGVRVETGGFFNPNVTNTFNLGSGGTCNLRVGYVFTIPANTTIGGDDFVGQIVTNAYYTGL